MPTGSGKTRTAMQIAAHHLVEKGPTTVVWLATSEELCDQAVAEFAATWQQAGDTEAKLIRAWGPHTLSLDSMLFEQNMFVVAGLAKLHSASRSDQQILPKLGDNVSLVIFDEAHQAIADTYRTVVDTLVARNANTQLLGLSATPGRSWNNPDLDRQLATYFGHSKVQLEVDGYRSPIDYLMHEGYLAHPNFTRIPHTPQGSLTDSQLQSLASALDVPEALREQFAQDELRNVAIVQECRRLIRKHKRALVFASTVSHSDLLAMVLQALGVAAHSLTGNTDRAERSRLIHWFHSDDPEARMLVNYGILTTGFDEPKTSAVLIARPTKSLVLYSQMVGRALRGPRAGGNPSAEVVTIVDTALPGFGDLVSAFNNWEDVW
jgi:superfamily II DNA or RNA helicase